MSFLRPCLVLGAVVLGSSGVYAQSQDGLKWRANVAATSYDNFFYTTNSPAAERVTAETLGVTLAIPYSLQRFEVDASVIANQYQNYSNFDYTSQNFNGTWFWSFTPRLHGSLNTTHTESLNAQTDSVDPTQRNKSTQQNTVFVANYDLGGPWQLTAAAVNSNTVNERAVVGTADDHSNGANAGVRYLFGSGSSVAYFRQVVNGESTFKYVQNQDDLSLSWILGSNTTLNGHVVYVQQRYDGASQFDFSGTTGGANIVWKITGKTSVTAGWQRDFASYQPLGSSYTQTDMFTVAPVWQISPITSVRLQYRDSVVTDQGNPFGVPSLRRDHLQDTTLAFSWQPYPQLSLSASLGQTTRTSNIPLNEYNARTLALTALLSF